MSKTEDFLVEIGTEELPPTALSKLSDAFANNVTQALNRLELSFTETQSYATPRRLALLVRNLQTKQASKTVNRRGPAVKAAYDNDNQPTKAALGFAKSCGVDLAQLSTIKNDQGEWLYYEQKQDGEKAHTLLPEIIQRALSKLPVPKLMRWGNLSAEFVRPVHWIVMMLGSQVIKTTLLGIDTSNETRGHRFHHPAAIKIEAPSQYSELLETQGKVIASFSERQQRIVQQIQTISKPNAQVQIDQALLDEVTGLVEWPVVLIGQFDKDFLSVPAEALISAMKTHQKSFPLFDTDNKLLPSFVFVVNIESTQPKRVIHGNERVIRARLADAQFFYESDLQHPLASYVDKLKTVIFQKQLGTLYDRSERLAQLTHTIAIQINANTALAERAATLSKADLMTDMVSEFPELQGIMGYYYARHAQEDERLAIAIKQHYLPRYAGDELPQSPEACALALADKLDKLVGIFGINQPPTGMKDPFALRRAALGCLRIMIEKALPLDLETLLTEHATRYGNALSNTQTVKDCLDFIMERLRAWYVDRGISAQVFAAVHARYPTQPLDFEKRIHAVERFTQLPEAIALAAANKRVSNILKKQAAPLNNTQLKPDLLHEAAEKELAIHLKEKHGEVSQLYQKANYTDALACLATLKTPIDRFFEEVMVMVEDKQLRQNRLLLLQQLRQLFLQVADISLLQTK